MNIDEFKKQMSEQVPKKDGAIPADQAGIIKISDIVNMTRKAIDVPDETKEEGKYTVTRMLLNMKGGVTISVPVSAMMQLEDLIKENKGIVAFKVLKTGTNISTRYSVSPIMGMDG